MHRDGEGKQIVFKAKDGHAHLGEHVTPLQRSVFEGIEVDVPTVACTGIQRECIDGESLQRV